MAQSRVIGSIQADSPVVGGVTSVMIQGRHTSVTDWLTCKPGPPVPVVMVDGYHLAVGHSYEYEKYLYTIAATKESLNRTESALENISIMLETVTRERDAMARDLQHEGELRRYDAAGLEEMKKQILELSTRLGGEKDQIEVQRCNLPSTIYESTQAKWWIMPKWAKIMVLFVIGFIVFLMIRES